MGFIKSEIIKLLDLLPKTQSYSIKYDDFINSFGSQLTRCITPVIRSQFTGTLELDDAIGGLYPDYNQTGVLTIKISANSVIGGIDRIKITSNGNSIDLDPAYTWKNIGGDAIGTTNGNVNIFYIMKVSSTEIEYTVKLN